MIKFSARSLLSRTAMLLYIAAATVAVHLLAAGNYGTFYDEWYTMACSRHLSLAFVDLPPVAPALLALNTALFGSSLFAMHILPSLFSGTTVVLVGLMASELGGGKFAIVFAGLCAAFVPVWMALGSLFTYDFLDQFMLMTLFYFVIRLVKRENPKLWLTIGLTAGVGLMTKPSEIFFIAGLALALLLTKHRKMYLTRWPWLGAAIALVIIAPAAIWQTLNGFPIVGYWTTYSAEQAVHSNPVDFALTQMLISNIILLPVWITGLCYLLFAKEGKKFRLLGVICCVLFAVFLLTGAKPYMPAPLYAVLIAGGAVALEKFISGRKWRRIILVPVYAAVIVLTGIIQAPLFIPALPVDTLVKYYNSVGTVFGEKTVKLDNVEQNDVLPSYFYNRFDWDVLVRDVAGVYDNLPENEKADVTIFSNNYGCAGAVDFLGEAYGLPKSTSGKLNYYFFSAENVKTGTWIVIGDSTLSLDRMFGNVQLARMSFSEYRQPHNLHIFLCKDPLFTVEQAKQLVFTY